MAEWRERQKWKQMPCPQQCNRKKPCHVFHKNMSCIQHQHSPGWSVSETGRGERSSCHTRYCFWQDGCRGRREKNPLTLGVFIFMSLNLEWETNSYWWIVSNHAPGRRFSHVSVLSHTHTHCLWSSLVFLSLSTAGSTIIHRHPRQSGLNGLLVAMGLGGISLYLENPLQESSDIQLTSQIIENTRSNYSIVCCLTEEMYIFISVTCAQNYF